MDILLILFLLHFFRSSLINATAEEIRVLVGPKNNLIFLIGEYHNKPNTNPGGNTAVVEKVTDILHQAEQ